MECFHILLFALTPFQREHGRNLQCDCISLQTSHNHWLLSYEGLKEYNCHCGGMEPECGLLNIYQFYVLLHFRWAIGLL